MAEEDARQHLLTTLIDEISNHFLEVCTTEEAWEDVDPELDEIRTKLQQMRGY